MLNFSVLRFQLWGKWFLHKGMRLKSRPLDPERRIRVPGNNPNWDH